MSKRIKRNNDELKADRPTIDEVKFIPRLPISILVENISILALVIGFVAAFTTGILASSWFKKLGTSSRKGSLFTSHSWSLYDGGMSLRFLLPV